MLLLLMVLTPNCNSARTIKRPLKNGPRERIKLEIRIYPGVRMHIRTRCAKIYRRRCGCIYVRGQCYRYCSPTVVKRSCSHG